jgi:hypothetical protein
MQSLHATQLKLGMYSKVKIQLESFSKMQATMLMSTRTSVCGLNNIADKLSTN